MTPKLDYQPDEVRRSRANLAFALRAASLHGLAQVVCNDFSIELPDQPAA